MSNASLKATIHTTKGDIRLNLFPDKTPLTVLNFVNLAKKGFYDGLTFHRVIPDFMIRVDARLEPERVALAIGLMMSFLGS